MFLLIPKLRLVMFTVLLPVFPVISLTMICVPRLSKPATLLLVALLAIVVAPALLVITN